jgi:sugar lactone lactonase YvrE
MLDVIEVPERPSCVTFGDSDNRTLYIAARSSLYKVRLKYPGRIISIDEWAELYIRMNFKRS